MNHDIFRRLENNFYKTYKNNYFALRRSFIKLLVMDSMRVLHDFNSIHHIHKLRDIYLCNDFISNDDIVTLLDQLYKQLELV